jgi:hypothetical protein
MGKDKIVHVQRGYDSFDYGFLNFWCVSPASKYRGDGGNLRKNPVG